MLKRGEGLQSTIIRMHNMNSKNVVKEKFKGTKYKKKYKKNFFFSLFNLLNIV